MATESNDRPKWAFDPTTFWIDDSDDWLFDKAAHEKTVLTRNDAFPLIVAAQTNDLATVRRHLSEGADVNAHGELGETALHMAVALGYTDIAAVLLEAGADPNAKGTTGREPSPLIQAARFCPAETAPEIIQMLLKAGADPSYTVTWDLRKLNPLQWAVHSANTGAIVPLLDVCQRDRLVTQATTRLRIETSVLRRGQPPATKFYGLEILEILLRNDVEPTISNLREALWAGSWPAFDLVRSKLTLSDEEFSVFMADALIDLVYEPTASPDLSVVTVARRFFEEFGLDVNFPRVPSAVIISGKVELLEMAVARGLDLKKLPEDEVAQLVGEAEERARWRGTPRDWRERITSLRQ